MIFIKTLLKILKQGLTLQIMSWKDRYQKEKTKKIIGLMKDKLGKINYARNCRIKSKTYPYLTDNNNEDKKSKRRKNVCHKKNLTFVDHKNCLETTQLENNINQQKKNKVNVDSLKKIIKNS